MATSRVLSRPMSSPSSTTDPLVGLSSRDRVRNRVDFPQPLEPMIVVITRGGIATWRSSMTTRPPYPTVTPLAASRAAPAPSDSIPAICDTATTPPEVGMSEGSDVCGSAGLRVCGDAD